MRGFISPFSFILFIFPRRLLKAAVINRHSTEKCNVFLADSPFITLSVLKVKSLENEKKMLEKKLELLKRRDDYAAKIDEIVKQKENELEEKIYKLLRDKDKLNDDLEKIQKERDGNKKRLAGCREAQSF